MPRRFKYGEYAVAAAQLIAVFGHDVLFLQHLPCVGGSLTFFGVAEGFVPAPFRHDEAGVLQQRLQAIVAAHMVEVSVRHEYESDVVLGDARGAEVFEETVHIRFMRGIYENPSSAGFDGP